MNENCLAGFKCPHCGYEDSFLVGGRTLFDVTDNGALQAPTADVEWGDDDFCACGNCDAAGTVKDFKSEDPVIEESPETVFLTDERIKALTGGT